MKKLLLFGFALLIFFAMNQAAGVPRAFAVCTTWTGPATVADTCITIPYHILSDFVNGSCTIFGGGCGGGSSFIPVDPQNVGVVGSPAATGPKGESEAVTLTTNTAPAQGETCSNMQTQTPPGCPAFNGTLGDYTATFNVDTSAYANGPYTATLSVFDSLNGQRLFSIPFQVSHGVAVNGTVKVTSENSAITTTPVPSQWDFTGSIVDPCGGSQANCSGTNVAYPGQPAGSFTDSYQLNPHTGSAGTLYALHSVQQNIAEKTPAPKNPVLAFVENFFATAHASVVCGFLDSNPSSCPTPAWSFTLDNAGDVANFTILWDPIANMGPIATPIALNSSMLSQVVPVANNGSAGSVLTWSAGAPTYTGAGGWLTATPSNGSVAGGSSQNITFTADPAAVSAGNHSATVTLTATSAPGVPASGNPLPSQTVTVNFDNGAVAPPVVIVSVKPSATEPVATSITATCSGGSGAYTWTASGPAVPTSGAGANFTFFYSTPSSSTYTVTCIDANNPNSTASVPITITQVTPVCAFGASPTQVVVPGNSTLSWTCKKATSCYIDTPANPVNAMTGTLNVSPASNTTYTLSCKGPGNGPGSTASVQTTVSVVGPGVIEGNP